MYKKAPRETGEPSDMNNTQYRTEQRTRAATVAFKGTGAVYTCGQVVSTAKKAGPFGPAFPL